jgi:hypothetical protein
MTASVQTVSSSLFAARSAADTRPLKTMASACGFISHRPPTQSQLRTASSIQWFRRQRSFSRLMAARGHPCCSVGSRAMLQFNRIFPPTRIGQSSHRMVIRWQCSFTASRGHSSHATFLGVTARVFHPFVRSGSLGVRLCSMRFSLPPAAPNHAMERTTGSFSSTLSMEFHPHSAAMRPSASRRSSCSR